MLIVVFLCFFFKWVYFQSYWTDQASTFMLIKETYALWSVAIRIKSARKIRDRSCYILKDHDNHDNHDNYGQNKIDFLKKKIDFANSIEDIVNYD